MRKIKNIKQLLQEKQRIKLQQQELERKLQYQWEELKECAKPSSIAANTFSAVLRNTIENKSGNQNLLKNIFSFGATILTDKLAEKAGEKISHLFQKKQAGR
ncbi:hypothetical protein [Ferruginibacter sp. SUN106]|uniref:hypothetical protein n=1 Tax=Ferruginibacter sp. SUN106 TaxID=2978348 RepID=UPI003D3666E9